MTATRSVVFLNRFYWPDHAATAQILTDLAEYLAARDWNVHVIAAATSYGATHAFTGAAARHGADENAAVRVTLARAEQRNGVLIVRTRAVRSDRGITAGSLAEYGSYAAGALSALASLPRPSVIVSMSDPPLLGAAVLPIARLKRSRFVNWVQDIHPDVAERVGVLPRQGPLRHALQSLSRITNRSADLTVTIGPAMASHLAANGALADRLQVIPNWVDTDAVRPLPAGQNALAAELGLQDKFVVLYSGNAARSHPLDAVVGAMQQMRDQREVVFLFIGGGSGHELVREKARGLGLTNCMFLESLPRNRIAESHSLAGACLVTESPDVAGLLFPSKSIGILASGRPLLFIGSLASEVAALVRRFDCGRTISPDDVFGLVREIELLRSNKNYRDALGERGRCAAVEFYDARVSCAAWDAALTSLVKTPRT